MLFGKAHKLEDEAAKLQAHGELRRAHVPRTLEELRPVNKQEIKATTVLSMKIEEGSAKIRTGPPKDDEEDYTWPVWAGVVPVQMVADARRPGRAPRGRGSRPGLSRRPRPPGREA